MAKWASEMNFADFEAMVEEEMEQTPNADHVLDVINGSTPVVWGTALAILLHRAVQLCWHAGVEVGFRRRQDQEADPAPPPAEETVASDPPAEEMPPEAPIDQPIE